MGLAIWMFRAIMTRLRNARAEKHDHAQNGHRSPPALSREELERLALEEARRYESDLRKLAKH